MKKLYKIDDIDKCDEALVRMDMLNISDYIINQFKLNKIIHNVYQNKYANPISNKLKDIIKDFELNYNSLVYYAISNNTLYGYTTALLYISDFKVQWDFDRKWLKENKALAYIHNYDNNELSTFQEIGLNQYYGLVQRLY